MRCQGNMPKKAQKVKKTRISPRKPLKSGCFLILLCEWKADAIFCFPIFYGMVEGHRYC